MLDETGLAIARLPKDFAAVAGKLQAESMSDWSRVCVVKGTFFLGSSQEKTGSVEEAIQSYRSVLPWLSSIPLANTSPQFRLWTEHLMVRLCHLSNQTSDTREFTHLSEALQVFRFWAMYWDSTVKFHGTEGANVARHRRLAWRAYYNTLSDILVRDLPYQPDSALSNGSNEKPSNHSKSRILQRAELKKVETIYENLLLKEIEFPKASETNHEIVAWVDSVMDNWRFLCGTTWSDADMGAGGKQAVGRGVLDVRYSQYSFCTLSDAFLKLYPDSIQSGNEDLPLDPGPPISVYRPCFTG